MDHAGHAVAHRPQVADVGVDELGGVEPLARSHPVSGRDDELRMRLGDVVGLDERLDGQLPVDGQAAGVPPLGLQRLHLPGVEARGERFEAVAERRCVEIEVDPRAAAPGLASDGREVEVAGLHVVLGERPAARDGGVLAVGSVAPAVERAGEPALAGAATDGHPDAAVATGVLERGDPEVLGAHHEDRLVEDLVLGEVARTGDLLEPAGHLPDPGPEVVDLGLVEVGVVVALLGHPVGEVHRERHRERRPLRFDDRHAGVPFPLGVPGRDLILTGRYNPADGHGGP